MLPTLMDCHGQPGTRHNIELLYKQKPSAREGLRSLPNSIELIKNGAKRIRTAGLLNAIEARYQLRYSPASFAYSIITQSVLIRQVLTDDFLGSVNGKRVSRYSDEW